MKGATVVWVESAEAELASIWMALPDRNKVAAATHAIDQALKRDAFREGVELAKACLQFSAGHYERSSKCCRTTTLCESSR